MRFSPPPGSPPALPHRWGGVVLAASVVAVSITACVYDSNNRCGEGQVLYTQGVERCVCADGWAYTSAGCVRCAANEVSGTAGCICAAGYGRNSPGEACTKCAENEETSTTGACSCVKGYSRGADGLCAAAPAGIGIACSTTTACSDATFNHCHMVDASSGYCTVAGCTSDANCTGGYVCDKTASPAYCRRPPVGQSDPCKTNADCAGKEASFCDTFVTQSCLVQGCTVSPDNCFTGSQCCDLSKYGLPTLCVAAGACQ